MSRTPADVPDLPGSGELTDNERAEVARLAARDAGGLFVPQGYLRDFQDYVARHEAADPNAAFELVSYLRAVLRDLL